MKRRQFVAASSVLVAAGGLSAVVTAADSAPHDTYSREAYDQAVADGVPFMLDFFAPW